MQITPLKIKAPFSLGLKETTKNRKDKTKQKKKQLEKAGVTETNLRGL